MVTLATAMAPTIPAFSLEMFILFEKVSAVPPPATALTKAEVAILAAKPAGAVVTA